MNRDYRAQAQAIYDRVPNREQLLRFYGKLTGIAARTVDEIEAHLRLCAEVGEEFGVTIHAERYEVGTTTREQLVEAAQAITKRSNRRAGARALVAKYGKEGAQDIIYRHTGKRYSLKG